MQKARGLTKGNYKGYDNPNAKGRGKLQKTR